MLGVTETWTNADGTYGNRNDCGQRRSLCAGLADLCLAGNDTLTGAGGNDLFVFAQPIGNDTIYNFNAASDKIDLIGFAGIASFSDLAVSPTTATAMR